MTMCAAIVLKDVTFPDGRIADISVCKGRVIHTGAGMACDRAIDCTGYLVLPGATDMHVHMRGGTQSAKEDWTTGSRSALAGGVTLVVDQPNTVPPLSTPDAFLKRVEDAKRNSVCNFAINSALTEITPCSRMWEAGAMAFGETFFGRSSYGDAIEPGVFEQLCDRVSRLSGLVTVHAESVSGVPGNDLGSHGEARSPQGEADAVRLVEQLNRSRCRLHFCHLSTAGAIDAVRESSIEVTPHHLFLSTESFRNGSDTRGKVNPPLRSERERKNLMSRWERIDIIASDHAPHTLAEKQVPFCDAPSGIPGVETMMPLLVAKVLDRTLPVQSLIAKTSENPARILGIHKAGFSVGDRADFALYPKTPAPIRADDLHSRCGWTPFEGINAVFPSLVIMDGSVVFDKGEFCPGNPRWFPGKGYVNVPPV